MSMIQSLPRELIWEIISFSEMDDLFRLFTVCKDFYNVSRIKEFWIDVQRIHFPDEKKSTTFWFHVRKRAYLIANPLQQFKRVWKNPTVDNSLPIKLCLLGTSNVGKTSFIKSLFHHHAFKNFCQENGNFKKRNFVRTSQTTGRKNMYHHDYKINKELFKLEILDHQESEFDYCGFDDSHLKESYCFIVFINTTDSLSMDEIVERYYTRTLRVNRVSDVPMIVVGTKTDLHEKREISKSEGIEIARKMNTKYYEISNKTGENVKFVLDEIMRVFMRFVSCKKDRDLPRNLRWGMLYPETGNHNSSKKKCCNIC